MTAQETTYLSVLRAGLWETPLNAEFSEEQIQSLTQIAKKQKTRGLVCNSILTSRQPALDDARKAKMRSFLLKVAGTHNLINHTMAGAVAYLRERGVETVLLKGQGVASYYRNPLLRECGDIDLYSGEKNYEKACNLIREFAGEKAASGTYTTPKHFHIDIDTVLVEVHHITENAPQRYKSEYDKFSDFGTSEGLVKKVFEGTEILTPSDNFNAFYIFHHIWHHFLTSGIGLRQMCDWTMFLHARHGCIDTSLLRSEIEKMGLTDPWRVFGGIAVEYLGLPADEMPLYEKVSDGRVEMVLGMILEEGNFGHERKYFKQRRKRLLGKIDALKAHISRSRRLESLFPGCVYGQFGTTLKLGIKKAVSDLIKHK